MVLAVFSLVETFPWNYYREYYHDEAPNISSVAHCLCRRTLRRT